MRDRRTGGEDQSLLFWAVMGGDVTSPSFQKFAPCLRASSMASKAWGSRQWLKRHVRPGQQELYPFGMAGNDSLGTKRRGRTH